MIASCANAGSTDYGFLPLVSLPDPAVAATKILQQVQTGKLVVDDDGAELYAILKTSSLVHDKDPRTMPEADAQKLHDQLGAARTEAQKEIIAAGLAATKGKGPAYVEALWTAFQEQAIHKNPGEPDPDGGKARAEMAAHQLELPPEHVQRLLDAWTYWGSAEFIPLLEREAAPPVSDVRASLALADLDPEKERTEIIKELGEPDSPLFSGHYPASDMLTSMKPMPLPQYDSLFRAKLAEAGANPHPIIPLIAAFGSPALLPDVEKAWQTYGKPPQGSWDDGIQSCLFHYWMRCDPEAGAAAMEAEMKSSGQGVGLFIMVFETYWSDDARPLLRQIFATADFTLTTAAINVVEERGDKSWIDSAIAALERLRTDKERGRSVPAEADWLLKSTHWSYSDVQKKQLEELAQAK